jgi:hypothetical protein
VIASEIKVIMPGSRLRTSGTAIERKGTPPTKKTSSDRPGATHSEPGKAGGRKANHCWIIGL